MFVHFTDRCCLRNCRCYFTSIVQFFYNQTRDVTLIFNVITRRVCARQMPRRWQTRRRWLSLCPSSQEAAISLKCEKCLDDPVWILHHHLISKYSDSTEPWTEGWIPDEVGLKSTELYIRLSWCHRWISILTTWHLTLSIQFCKLEWGFPNGTKYPPRQPIPNRAILPNRARVYRRTDRRTDGRTDRVIPVYPPLTSLRGV